MKRFFAVIAAAFMAASAQAAVECDLIINQLDAFQSSIGRVAAVPNGCTGTPGFVVYDTASAQPRIFPFNSTLVFSSGVVGINPSTLAGKFDTPTGTTAQYVRGDGSLATLPAAPLARSFNYPTRALNTCFQVSNTRDALVSYSVDIATSLSLTTGQQGTVYLRIYSNSSCTTGAQEITRFVNGQTGTLTIGLALTQNVTGTLTGVVPAGAYVQLVTENNTGTPTFTARPGQETAL